VSASLPVGDFTCYDYFFASAKHLVNTAILTILSCSQALQKYHATPDEKVTPISTLIFKLCHMQCMDAAYCYNCGTFRSRMGGLGKKIMAESTNTRVLIIMKTDKQKYKTVIKALIKQYPRHYHEKLFISNTLRAYRFHF